MFPSCRHQVQHVLQGSFAFSIPKNDATPGIPGHDEVLGRVIGEVFPVVRRGDVPDGPGTDIVPAVLPAKDLDVGILAVREMLLRGLVRSVRVADQDRLAAADEFVQPVANCLVPFGNRSRSANQSLHPDAFFVSVRR